MSVRAKIKYILATKELKLTDYAASLKRSKQSVNLKLANSSFSLKDMVELADLTGYRISVVDRSGKEVISFDKDDFMPDEKAAVPGLLQRMPHAAEEYRSMKAK